MKKVFITVITLLFVLCGVCALAQQPGPPTPGVLISNPQPGTTAKFCGFSSVGGTPILCGTGMAGGSLSAALANARNVPVSVVVVGDEFSICDATNCSIGPTVSANRWGERLRVALQAQYGSHGTGIVPVSPATSLAVNPEAWACTGTYDTATTTLGPTQDAYNAVLHLANGASCTFHDSRNIVWDTLNTYCATTSSSGSLAISIDGGAYKGTACSNTTPSATAHAATLTANSSASHSVTFTSTGDNYLYAAEGQAGIAGVSVSNLAISGAEAAMFGSAPATQLAFSDLTPNGQQVFVLAEGQINDATAGTPSATYQSELQAIVTHELSVAGSGRVALAILPQNVASTQYDLPSYIAAQVSLCTATNIPCANLAAAWGAYSPTTGLWDSTGDTGTLWSSGDSFGVVLNDTGNYAAFREITQAITN